jgi:hypothetical protein
VTGTLDAHVASLASGLEVDDVAAVAPHVAADLSDLRSRRLAFGPTFAASLDLGGADADLIAGDLLLDFKATATSKLVTRPVLLQLVGYALADTHDQFQIRHVGVAALRWRRRWTIALDDLLEQLARAPVDVARLRGEFAELCATLRRQPGTRPQGPAA